MSKSINISLGGFTDDMVIKFDSSHLINMPKDLTNLYLDLALLALTIPLNIWAVVVVSGKEKTGINCLIISDCVASIAYLTLGPWYPFESNILCTVTALFLFILTRLLAIKHFV